MSEDRIFHVISNTHWDREWRYPFQKNRQRLVKMMDELLEILENNPDYHAFHLDSQTVMLEDYLEVKPHKEEQLKKFIKNRRLFVGPWYTLPEEFQVGGENLIRNLLFGHRIGKKFGHVMKVGYSPFSWGQISQLPQIYKGFDIPVIMFYRGVNSLDSEKAEFVWEGADGTQALSSRFSTWPRYNFYFYIYRPVVHNEQPQDIEFKWERGGLPFHFADKDLHKEDYSLVERLQEYYPENLEESVEKIIADQVDDFTTRHIFWAEGHDSSGPNGITPKIVDDINEFIENGRAVHSDLEKYAQGLESEAVIDELPVVKGERRSAQYDQRSSNLYGYTTSARMYLKQLNFTAEKWVQYYAEPLNSIAGMLGMDNRDKSIDLAWKLLVKNSAHDSIGGCSLDEIHDDMENRYKQCIEIAKSQVEKASQYIISQIELSEEINLVIFNTLPFERDEVIEAYIDIPAEKDLGSIKIFDQGQELNLEILSRTERKPILERLVDRPMYFSMVRYHVLLKANNVPRIGFKTFHVKPVKSENKMESDPNESVLENEFLKVDFNPDGTFNVTYKETGQVYSGLGYFYDEGEAGHAWVNEPTRPFYTTRNSNPEIDIVESNPLRQIAEIRYSWELPKNVDERQKSNPKMLNIPIKLKLILEKKSRHLKIKIDLENKVECHRLRFMFPTGLNALSSFGEGQFDVVERPVERKDTSDWIEQPMYDYPMHHFVDLFDGEKGAAVLVSGLKEYEALDDEQGTLAITLLRSFDYRIPVASMQDYSDHKGTQCLGKQSYKLAFYPHKGNWQAGQVFLEAMLYNYETRIVQTGRGEGRLDNNSSFIEFESEQIITSALKKAEDGNGYIIRLYNPGKTEVEEKIKFNLNLSAVFLTNLEEKKVNKVTIVNDNYIKIKIASKTIQTYRLIP
mgnify:CR=1 FL=1